MHRTPLGGGGGGLSIPFSFYVITIRWGIWSSNSSMASRSTPPPSVDQGPRPQTSSCSSRSGSSWWPWRHKCKVQFVNVNELLVGFWSGNVLNIYPSIVQLWLSQKMFSKHWKISYCCEVWPSQSNIYNLARGIIGKHSQLLSCIFLSNKQSRTWSTLFIYIGRSCQWLLN